MSSEEYSEEEEDGPVEGSFPMQKVYEALLDIKSGDRACKPGNPVYCVWGKVPGEMLEILNPGLKIDGQTVPLPVTEAVLNSLMQTGALEQAPFGKGTETVMDLAVRKTLQVDPSRVSFKNPKFLAGIKALAERTVACLGVNEGVVAHLHKLLIYSPGDFFKPHRDGVHSPNQFATLVLQLPSEYMGGLLKVSLGDSTSEVDMAFQDAQYTTQYATFFSDCLHEVLPIDSGYRTCLTFDICHADPAEASESASKRTKVGDVTIDTTKLREALTEWKDQCTSASAAQHPLSKGFCSCGQVALPNSLRPHGDDGDDENTKDGKARDFRRRLRKNRKTSDSSCLLLVLDHMLPANVLSTMDSSNLGPSLWAFRGADRIRLQALLSMYDLMDDFEIYSGVCGFAYGGWQQTSFSFSSRGLCKPGKQLMICPCMIRSTSKAALNYLSFERYNTGNEGVQVEYEYEYHGLFIFPKQCKPQIVCALSTYVETNFAMLNLTPVEGLQALSHMEGFQGKPLELNVSTTILRHIPISLLLRDDFLGNIEADPMSPNVKLAMRRLFAGYAKESGKNQSGCLDWLNGHTNWRDSAIEDNKKMYKMLHRLLIRTADLVIQKKEITEQCAFLSDVLEVEYDISLVRSLLHRYKDDTYSISRVLLSAFWRVAALDAAMKRVPKEEATALLNGTIKPIVLDGLRRYSALAEKPEPYTYLDNSVFVCFARVVACIIEKCSQPECPLYSFAVEIAGELISSHMRVNMAVFVEWPREGDNFKGTIVMRPVVESLKSAMEAFRKKTIDEALAQKNRPPPPGCPEDLRAFIADHSQERFQYSKFGAVQEYLNSSFEGKAILKLFSEWYGFSDGFSDSDMITMKELHRSKWNDPVARAERQLSGRDFGSSGELRYDRFTDILNVMNSLTYHWE